MSLSERGARALGALALLWFVGRDTAALVMYARRRDSALAKWIKGPKSDGGDDE